MTYSFGKGVHNMLIEGARSIGITEVVFQWNFVPPEDP